MEHKPNFYAIIPAHVRYSKDIEMGAKLLYAEITSLTHAAGYCWATNQYFADLYDVDYSTVRRWIKSLKDHKFIFIEVEKKGIQTSRKIWVSLEIQRMFTEGHFRAPPCSKMSTPVLKNAPHNTKQNTKEERITPPNPLEYEGEHHLSDFELKEPKGGEVNANGHGKPKPIPPKPKPKEPDRIEHGKFVMLSSEEYNELGKQHGKATIDEVIEEINDHLESTGKKPYKGYAATIRNWIRRRVNIPSSSRQVPKTGGIPPKLSVVATLRSRLEPKGYTHQAAFAKIEIFSSTGHTVAKFSESDHDGIEMWLQEKGL